MLLVLPIQIVMPPQKPIIDGRWLKTALDAQRVGVHATARALGHIHHKYYRHINNHSYLNAQSMVELLLLYPTMNARYILTGEGSPVTK